MKSLSSKIALGYFVLIAINFAIAIFAVYHIYQLGQPFDHLLKENYKNIIASENLVSNLEQRESRVFRFVEGNSDSADFSQLIPYTENFWYWHRQAISEISLPQEPPILDSLQILFRTYLQNSDSLEFQIGRKYLYKSIKSYHSSSIVPTVLKITKLCNRLKEENDRAIVQAGEKAQKLSTKANLLILTFAFFAIVLSVIAAIYFTRIVVRPLKKTTETVRRIGRGNFNQKINIQSDDEMAELGIEFNKMTERLEAYEQLNVQKIISEKKKSEAVVAHIPVGLVAVDGKNQLVLINKAAKKILGIEENNWQDRPVSDLIQDKKIVELVCGHQEGDEIAHFSKADLIKIDEGKTVKFYNIRQFKIESDGTGYSGGITLFQDVTKFKELDKLKSEFISTISHEIRTPLTSLNMGTDILLAQKVGKINPDQKELLRDVKSDVNRIRSFIQELLELARLESGKDKLNFESITLQNAVEEALCPLRHIQKQKGIGLVTEIRPDTDRFEGDLRQVTRLLTNLIKNAIEYTPAGGQINIISKQEDEQILIIVKDNGKGIPADILPIIFDKFIYLQDIKDTQTGNYGLGLSISREIVKAHQGKIWVESVEGQGSTFYVLFPLKQQDQINVE